MIFQRHVINIVLENGVKADKNTQKLIKRCIKNTLELKGIDMKCIVTVMLTDNVGIQELNAKFRNVDAPTDVLSFPALDLVPGDTLEGIESDRKKLYLGDIAISMERVEQQAEEFGHSFDREAGYLSIHSMLHLLGYDHMNEEDKKVMRAEEEKVLDALRLFR